MFQVEVNECAVGKFQDSKGEISKDDFIKFAQDSKLLDFGNAMGGEVIKLGGVGGGQGRVWGGEGGNSTFNYLFFKEKITGRPSSQLAS